MGGGANMIRSTPRLVYMHVRTFTMLREFQITHGFIPGSEFSPRNQCSIFRPWQGWTSMSTTGPGEGTLRVAPLLKLATVYLILRPFFKPRTPSSGLDDWVVDLESPTFPGSQMGKTQALCEVTHPHLQLSRIMVSIPLVEPGDQIYCGSPTSCSHRTWSGSDDTLGHCDTIHSVEHLHGGPGDSSVLYIPAVPLTIRKRVPSCRAIPPILSHCPHTALNIFKFSESTSIVAFLPREFGKSCF
jgi:Protein of unknown function (DUF1479)